MSFLALFLILLLPVASVADTTQSYPCDPSSQVQSDIDFIQKHDSTSSERLKRLRDLLKKYPGDIFVHRVYQDEFYFAQKNVRDLAQEYLTLYEKNPKEPVFIYLYGRALIRARREKSSLEMYSSALKIAPNLPQLHVDINRHYWENPDLFKHHLGESIRLCPGSVHSYKYVEDVKDQDFLIRASKKIRDVLNEQITASNVKLFPILWALDFKITPPNQHGETRTRIAEDVDRLFNNQINELSWWTSLKDGYNYLGKSQEISRVVQEISRRFPENEAYDVVREHWFETHRRPETEAERKEYDLQFLSATEDWIQRWPNRFLVWFDRLSAVSFEGAPPEKVKQAIQNVLRLLEEGSDGVAVYEIYVSVAETALQTGLDLDQIPQYLKMATKAWDQYASWAFPEESADPVNDRREYHEEFQWSRLEVLAKFHLKKNDYQQVHRLLAEMFPFTKDGSSRWWTHRYWQLKGDLAKALNQNEDAKKYYSKAAEFVARKPEEVKEPLPDFVLTDMNGKAWKLNDWKGKVVFINVWATWCGPCTIELPFVQRLHEDLKDRPDALVVTFNIDEDAGLVQPYVNQNRFSFPVLLASSYVEKVRPNIGIPQNWVVDADGNVRFFSVGFGGSRHEEFVKMIHGLMEKYEKK